MAFPPKLESGELHLRQADLDDTTIAQSQEGTRVQYGPDNRKVPPEPLRAHEDVTAVSAPSSSDLFATAVGAVAHELVNPDGSVTSGIVVGFTPPNWWGPASRYDVYAADEADFPANCFLRVGSVPADRIGKGQDHWIYHPFLVRDRTYTIALVPVNADGAGIEPEAAPQITGVAITGTGQAAPDVAGFDAFPVCCDIAFTWTPTTILRNDIAYYEIRQGATFAGGTFVARAWGWNQNAAEVPIGEIPLALTAPNDEFHIAAFTNLGAESATEGSDTLTAVQIALLQSYCCTKIREISPTAGQDTVPITSLAPTPPGIQPNISVGGSSGTPGPNGVLRGGIDPTSFVPNGSRWDYSVVLSDIAVTGDRIYVTEGVRLAI